MNTDKLTMREITSYPWRLDALTDEGEKIGITCKHDELRIRIGDGEFTFALDALQMAEARSTTSEVIDPTPPA